MCSSFRIAKRLRLWLLGFLASPQGSSKLMAPTKSSISPRIFTYNGLKIYGATLTKISGEAESAFIYEQMADSDSFSGIQNKRRTRWFQKMWNMFSRRLCHLLRCQLATHQGLFSIGSLESDVQLILHLFCCPPLRLGALITSHTVSVMIFQTKLPLRFDSGPHLRENNHLFISGQIEISTLTMKILPNHYSVIMVILSHFLCYLSTK